MAFNVRHVRQVLKQNVSKVQLEKKTVSYNAQYIKENSIDEIPAHLLENSSQQRDRDIALNLKFSTKMKIKEMRKC